MKNRFNICSFACVGVLTWAALGGSVAAAVPEAAVVDFSMRALSGEVVRLSEHRGSVVVLGFWARWCGDCRQAMQALDGINEKYQRAGLLTVGINVGDTVEQTAAMTRSLGLRFPVLIDTEKTASSQFNLKTMPLIVLLDRDGKLRYAHEGFTRGDEVTVAAQLQKLLNE
jgi:peroxiredoxin